MPTRTVWIAAVRETRLLNTRTGQWFSRFTVFTRPSPVENWSEEYSTTDALKASLCHEAKRLDRAVVIASRDNWYGPDIVAVELAQQEVA